MDRKEAIKEFTDYLDEMLPLNNNIDSDNAYALCKNDPGVFDLAWDDYWGEREGDEYYDGDAPSKEELY